MISIRRKEVKPFTDKQVALLETFASQAVIAIENVRLFKELQERNRDLTEALEQQTATGKILEVIASSPTDIQPVLEAIAESATRLCEAYDASIGHVVGDILRLNAHSTDPSRWRDVPITRGHIGGEAILDRRTVHIHDLAAEDNIRAPSWINLGVRTVLVRRCCAKARRSGRSRSVGWKSVRLQKTDRAARDLCEPGGYRYRERAAVQRIAGTQRRIARSPGASDGNSRGARYHQPLAHGRAAGSRCHRRERGAGLSDR